MTLNDDVERGTQAQALIANPMFQEAFENVSNAIHEQWASCPVRDREGAHELRLMLKLLNDLKAVLESTIENGKLAVMELERLNSNVISPKEFFNR